VEELGVLSRKMEEEVYWQDCRKGSPPRPHTTPSTKKTLNLGENQKKIEKKLGGEDYLEGGEEAHLVRHGWILLSARASGAACLAERHGVGSGGESAHLLHQPAIGGVDVRPRERKNRRQREICAQSSATPAAAPPSADLVQLRRPSTSPAAAPVDSSMAPALDSLGWSSTRTPPEVQGVGARPR
jgi:hypothetical protein